MQNTSCVHVSVFCTPAPSVYNSFYNNFYRCFGHYWVRCSERRSKVFPTDEINVNYSALTCLKRSPKVSCTPPMDHARIYLRIEFIMLHLHTDLASCRETPSYARILASKTDWHWRDREHRDQARHDRMKTRVSATNVACARDRSTTEHDLLCIVHSAASPRLPPSRRSSGP